MKKIIFGITLIVTGFLFGSCAKDVIAEQSYPLKIWKHNENGKMETFCVIDENTGVNYIVVTGELYQKGIGTAITPRLNADGTLYVK